MADPAGTNGEEGTGCNGWFYVEAVVEKKTGDAISDDENENDSDTGEDLVDFIVNDNDYLTQAETETAHALFTAQEAKQHRDAVQVLKRKYLGSPLSDISGCVDNNISPRLKAICIEKQSRAAKRRLFESENSGYGNTEVETQQMLQVEGRHETETPCSQYSGGSGGGCSQYSSGSGGEGVSERHTICQTPLTNILNVLKTSNAKAAMLAKFKELYGVSFTELVRPFKSNKSTCCDWCIAAFGLTPSIADSIKTLLQQYCLYLHIQSLACSWGMVVLLLVRYKCGKNRETIEKLLSKLLCVSPMCMMIEPPKLRSTAAALYWYKTGISNISEVYGDTPEWIQRQTVLQHSFNDCTFELSQMVQWAYDNDIVDDSEIAYKYAQLADTNSNASAFLKSNSQAKIVKDCATMCRHYKRAEKKQMSMSQWIKYRCDRVDDGGDWKQIVMFLRYQGVEFMSFLTALKRFLQGIPKKNCILLYGAANTGKSLFGMSLMKFLQGSVICFVNSKSHFWLQPLADAKIGMLDDATVPCWNYIDDNLRNALDGNLVSMDVKHRPLVQLKCPPLLITSNINAGTDSRWPYLHNRLVVFTFPNEFPFDENGNPVYELNDKNWKSFFSRTWSRLSLHEDEDKENDGDSLPTFKCVSGQNTNTL
uniref:Replication protein E1 n=1 Tax=Human papillomavirus type 16 TaxID=333760 RepID=A0A2P1I6W5_HPV16|nr:E1 [Human papillomavirus 16]